MTLSIGFLIYPRMTQLDFTGPFEVFSHLPGAAVHVAAKTTDPVAADTGLRIMPTISLADCPQLDILCVPGGPHVDEWFEDEELLGFLRTQAASARYVTSVCTGSLVLGAAGLLEGYRADTHWSWLEVLAAFGATPDPARVVRDRNRVTGGGVTAGIDFALTLAAEVAGEPVAKAIQLAMEYNPAPPFVGGHPDVAEKDILRRVTAVMEERVTRRKARAAALAART
jgi:cyclohexyl-isocyanide hydratase